MAVHLRFLTISVGVLVVLAGACQAGVDRSVGPAPAASPTPTASPTPAASPAPAASSTPTTASPCDPLALEQRAGLVLVVGLPEVTDADDPLVEEVLDIGVGGAFLAGYNVTGTDQVRRLTEALHEGSDLLIATDEEWGRVSSFRDLFGSTSSARTIAAEHPPREVRAMARDLGRSLADLGIDWNFAPVADLDDGPSDGVIGDRAFSATPKDAARYAGAFAEGLSTAGVLPTVKHFPGHGAVADAIDPHEETVTSEASVEQLRSRDLLPFDRLIDDGVPVVMVNHVTYPALDDLPASMSPAAYELLRDQGFDGVAITDSIGMGAIHQQWDFPEATEQALAAGADAVLTTDGRQAQDMRDRIVAAVRQGRLPEERLSEAATRMLRLQGADPSDLLPC